MKTTLEPLEGNKVKLSVEVDEAEFDRDIDAAFKKIAREVNLPGFRAGKAPRRLLEARIGLGPAREQALRDANIATRDIDRLVFVGGPTRMPVVRQYFEDLFQRKAEQGVDPMECVACGAAVQAGVLSGEVGDIVLVDVTPLTLGVETLGGVATPLISRNTPVPVKRGEIFTTAADLQTAVTVHV